MQGLWDPGQQVVPQGVVNGDAKVSGAGQKGGLGAAAAHAQHVGDTHGGQLVLDTQHTTRFRLQHKYKTEAAALTATSLGTPVKTKAL